MPGSLLWVPWILLAMLNTNSTPSNMPAPAAAAPAIRVVGRDVFFEAVPGVCVRAESFYTQRDGMAKMRFRAAQTQSDKNDLHERSFSDDNGRTWSEPESLWVVRKTPEGTRRRGFKSGWVDPVTGFLLIMGGQGLSPRDNPVDPDNSGNLSLFLPAVAPSSCRIRTAGFTGSATSFRKIRKGTCRGLPWSSARCSRTAAC